ncbi:glutamate--cysteine ligase regulatory subunit [Culicoides brevitarsis]|uniref:glutamate--cysteine ligase regulatory subunit n=1 Tax=Culicoides brevitarsis TaxID=469753 RepID=UPI00307BF730
MEKMNGVSKGRYIMSTGNVLNVAELRKKAGQKPAEELVDALDVTIKNAEKTSLDNGTLQICMKDNDLHTKMKELTRDEIKVGAKVFLNDFSQENLRVAIDTALRILDITFLNSLVLAYHPKMKMTNGSATVQEPEIKEGVIHWGDGTGKCFDDLKELWTVLEEYVDQKKICLLGVSDINCETLKQLYESAKHPPAITQINLSACCVVPPDLKDFCHDKEIQLLTHSDPQEIITKEALVGLNLGDLTPTCTLRYQVHIKCRGVLQAKGFIVSADH